LSAQVKQLSKEVKDLKSTNVTLAAQNQSLADDMVTQEIRYDQCHKATVARNMGETPEAIENMKEQTYVP
jgi:hypothetical protein